MAEWTVRLEGIKCAVLPSRSPHPNPLIVDDFLVVALAGPGQLHVYQRASGKLVWMRDTPSLGRSEVIHWNGLILGGSAHTLEARDLRTGTQRWAFHPYGRHGEWIYAPPAIDEVGHLYVGDRRGYVHCLEAASGRPLWQADVANGHDVNSEACVVAETVIVAANSGFVYALDRRIGKQLWKCQTGEPMVCVPQPLDRAVVVSSLSTLFLVDVCSGELMRKWTWRGRWIQGFTVHLGRIVVLLNDDPSDRSASKNLVSLVALTTEGTAFDAAGSAYVAGGVRVDAGKQHAYASGISGIDVFDLIAGSKVAELRSNGMVFGIPDTRDDYLYALQDHPATLFALRLPHL